MRTSTRIKACSQHSTQVKLTEGDAVVELVVELVVEALVERTSLGLLIAELSFCLPNPEGGIAGELQPLRLRQQGDQAPADLHGE